MIKKTKRKTRVKQRKHIKTRVFKIQNLHRRKIPNLLLKKIE
jgi:hypothetical protein